MLTRDYTSGDIFNLYETDFVYLKMGIGVTRFKFENSNTPLKKYGTSNAQSAKFNFEFGSAPRLVGGTSLAKLASLDHSQVKLLSQAAVHSMDATRAVLMKWRRQGHSLTEIYLQGIAQSTRHIGHLWATDELDFVNGNIAYARLHHALHDCSAEFLAEGGSESNGLSLLLLTEPASQHGIGAFMLSEFFRRAGWRIMLVTPEDIADFKRVFLSDWFDAVVLSISTDRHIKTVSEAVMELRDATINPQLKIYVGGPMAQLLPSALHWQGTLLLDQNAAQTVETVTQVALASASFDANESLPIPSVDVPR